MNLYILGAEGLWGVVMFYGCSHSHGSCITELETITENEPRESVKPN